MSKQRQSPSVFPHEDDIYRARHAAAARSECRPYTGEFRDQLTITPDLTVEFSPAARAAKPAYRLAGVPAGWDPAASQPDDGRCW